MRRRVRRLRQLDMRDRVGLCWRPELAPAILTNLERIDVIEVIADDSFASKPRAQALRMLAAQRPLLLHGVSLGLASTCGLEEKRLADMARLFERVRPEAWSEHLAFVRAGGVEIGHMAAPPRTANTIDATAVNVDKARRAVGEAPTVENVATLIDPPASDLDEAAWLRATLEASGAGLLLDLHNLYANSLNFGGDATAALGRLPLDRVRETHIAGGKWMNAGAGARRWLDDHLHDPPGPVYELLEALAEACPNPLTVILERDGEFPAIENLLAQLDLARAAIARGRERRQAA